MALRTVDPDGDSVELVRARLAELVGRPDFRDRRLAAANPLGLALAAPHDVYTLGLDELAAGTDLNQARVVGRRFLVLDGDTAVAEAEVAGPVCTVTEGRFVDATVRAVKRAEDAGADAELRVLRVPALKLMALWLHDGPDGDTFVPLNPAPSPLRAGRSYALAELQEVLARMAGPRLVAEDATGG